MKPFISYIGSKTKIMTKLEQYFPKEINRYFEPFVGGGSVLFYIGNKFPNIKEFYINDKETRLIDLYITLKNECDKLLCELDQLEKKKTKDDFLYYLKYFNSQENITKFERSILYLYFLKLSFNNNLKYDHNGKIKPNYSKKNAKSILYTKENITDICRFLQNVNIYALDYILFLKSFEFKKNDFIFLDPPYFVERVNEYYSSTFSESDYELLLTECDRLHKAGVKWMLTLDKSKSHCNIFKEYTIKSHNRYSFITNGRKSETEILITNY